MLFYFDTLRPLWVMGITLASIGGTLELCLSAFVVNDEIMAFRGVAVEMDRLLCDPALENHL